MIRYTSQVPTVLKTVGWIYLCAGIVLAFVIGFSMIEVNSPGYSYKTEINPVGIVLTIGVLFQAIVICTLFQGFSVVVEMQIDMRNHTCVDPVLLKDEVKKCNTNFENILKIPSSYNIQSDGPLNSHTTEPTLTTIICPKCKKETNVENNHVSQVIICRHCNYKWLAASI